MEGLNGYPKKQNLDSGFHSKYNLAVILTEWVVVVNAANLRRLDYLKYLFVIYSNTLF